MYFDYSQMTKIPAIIAKKAVIPPFVAKEIAADEGVEVAAAVLGVEASELDVGELELYDEVTEDAVGVVATKLPPLETAGVEPEEVGDEEAPLVVSAALLAPEAPEEATLGRIVLIVVAVAVGVIVVLPEMHSVACAAAAAATSVGQFVKIQAPESAMNCASAQQLWSVTAHPSN